MLHQAQLPGYRPGLGRLACLARVPELTLVSAREFGQERSQARELSLATSFDHPFVDTQEEFFYTFPIKIAEEIGDIQ